MESTCTLEMPKHLFNSNDEPPTEQYLHIHYDYMPRRDIIGTMTPSFDEAVDHSSFIGKFDSVDQIGDLNRETKK
eukprot:3303627-Ditylum_brightwellii.AAC.1